VRVRIARAWGPVDKDIAVKIDLPDEVRPKWWTTSSEFPTLFCSENITSKYADCDFLRQVSEKKEANAVQNFCWLVSRARAVHGPIPGTSKCRSPDEKPGAVDVQLKPADLVRSILLSLKSEVHGGRMNEDRMSW